METIINGGIVKELFALFGLVVAAIVNDAGRVQNGHEIQSQGSKKCKRSLRIKFYSF